MQQVEFYWDPMCPFAWVTSRWVVKVEAQLDVQVDWRFICLRFLNEGKNYDTDFPEGYATLHDKGRRMLRVAAAVRAAHGRDAMGPLYTAFGESIWDRTPKSGVDAMREIAESAHLEAVLTTVSLDTAFAAAADDEQWDHVLRDETEVALSRAGRDVGTPIIAIDPPDGPGFFGPVISRVPGDDEAVELWHSVLTLARWPGFAEIKRSLREMPQLPLITTST